MPEVQLHFTQEDRDMLRDTNRDVKTVLATVTGHETRVAKLEKWQTRVAAVCTFVGFVAGLAVKFLR